MGLVALKRMFMRLRNLAEGVPDQSAAFARRIHFLGSLAVFTYVLWNIPKSKCSIRCARKTSRAVSLGANFGFNCGGERIGPALNVFFVLGFHHDAHHRLRAGIAQHHAARIAESCFRLAQSAGNARQ